jgi:hypothetical protein
MSINSAAGTLSGTLSATVADNTIAWPVDDEALAQKLLDLV